MDNEALLKKLKTIFIQEANERINSIATNLVKLEQTEDEEEKKEVFQVIFREMHSLKGASRSVNLVEIENFFQVLENLFHELKSDINLFVPSLIGTTENTMNAIELILNEENIESADNCKKIQELRKSIEDYININFNGNNNKTSSKDKKNEQDSENLKETPSSPSVTQDEEIENKEMIPAAPTAHKTSIEADKSDENNNIDKSTKNLEIKTQKSSLLNTVRITSSMLDSILLKSENLIQIKHMFFDDISNLNNILNLITNLKHSRQKIESEIIFLKQQICETEGKTELQHLNSIVDYLENLDVIITNLESEIKRNSEISKENQRNSEKQIDSFLNEIKEIAMLPFSNILDIFPRMIKDISKELGKEINFEIIGEDNRIDRRILQELRDPLIHIIRNCIDHGIENSAARKKLGKPEKGKIRLLIEHNESKKINIIIEDDGKGVDEAKIKQKLIQNNIIDEENVHKLSKEELYDYLFFSGFSTKDIISDISGRGLGLAIVKENLDNLGGKLIISSEKDIGTIMKLILPVALSTFKGVLIKAEGEHFILPSINVEKVARIKNPEVKKIENRDAIVFQDRTYPLISLANVLNLPINKIKGDSFDDHLITCIIEKNNKFMALQVDDVIEEQEILVKDLGAQLKKVKNISGATILNSGKIVPILNIQDLFLSAINARHNLPQNTDKIADEKNETDHTQKTILEVEDSMTSRILLKNILESAGYKVYTAVDGLAALSVLKTQKIDIVVSDIEMPNMNGFQLTKNIRKNDKYKDLPIILVTSLSSDEDKEKGVTAGANAYIVKSQFDQVKLLEIIKSLL
jgi:two-component system, chemotaxis family, sensor kinase CheA